MKLSPRERWMLVLLPPFLISTGYFLFFAHSSGQEREKLRRQVAAQGPLSVRQAAVRSAQADLADVKAEVATLTRTTAAATPPHDRARALQLISQLAQNHGLTLLASAPDPQSKLPPGLQENASPSASGPAPQAPALWRVELTGAYPGVVALLDGLRTAEPFVVPLSAGMKTAPNESAPRTWTLTLWL